jgi:hypothetical protein
MHGKRMIVDWRSCLGINAESENEFLDQIVNQYRDFLGRDLVSLEIGSYHGLSSALLAQYGTVFAIDLWGDIHDCESDYETIGQVNFVFFIQNMLRLQLLGRVFPLVSTSQILNHLPPMKFDVIYIDGGHYYHLVRMDIERTRRHLGPNGLLICHDYKRNGDAPDLGVNIVVDELLATEKWIVIEKFQGTVVLTRSGQ